MIGEKIFQEYIENLDGLSCRESYDVGGGDFIVYNDNVDGRNLWVYDVNQRKRFSCKVEIKTSLDKFPRMSNILTPLQKEKPKYDYIVRIKLNGFIDDGFSGKINKDDLDLFLNDKKLAYNKTTPSYYANIPLLKCKEVIKSICIRLIKDYFNSMNYEMENNYFMYEKGCDYELYRNNLIKDKLIQIKGRLVSSYETTEYAPYYPDVIPDDFLIKVFDDKCNRKYKKQSDIVFIGCFYIKKYRKYKGMMSIVKGDNLKEAKLNARKKNLPMKNIDYVLTSFYKNNPCIYWNYGKHKTKFDEIYYNNVITLNHTIHINQIIIESKMDDAKFDYRIDLKIDDDFHKGFKGIFDISQLNNILNDKRVGIE